MVGVLVVTLGFIFYLHASNINSDWSIVVLISTYLILILSITLFFLLYFPGIKTIISKWFHGYLITSLPTISETEMTVINSGNTWIEKDIFQGNIDWYETSKIKNAKLSTEESAFLKEEVEEVCSKIDVSQDQKRNDLSPEVWEYLKSNKFFGLVIPKEYGGLGFSATAHSSIVSKLAVCSQPLAVSVMVPNSLGPGELLLHYGTEEQKSYYLPRLANGEEIPCFALTSPTAGSDATSIEDSGIVCYEEFGDKGKVLGLRLNWEKRYITLSPIATLLGLAFKAYDPNNLLPDDHPLSGRKQLGITLATIPTNTPGISIGNRHDPMNVCFQNGPNRGKDVFIPMDYVVGGIDRLGHGWKMLTECLSVGRGISLPSLSVAGAKVSLFTASSYCTIRQQFGLPLSRFEAIADKIADLGVNVFATESAQKLTSTAIDAGNTPAIITAMVKYKNTELLRQSINTAFDLHGGKAIMCGPRNYLEELYRSIPIAITVEGANILTKSLIVFGQGVMRCHPYLLQEIEALNEKDSEKSVKQLTTPLFNHMGYTVGNFFAGIAHNFSLGYSCRAVGNKTLRRMSQAVSATSHVFSFISDLALIVFGGSLKRRGIISSKFATVWTNLYYATACIKRYQELGEPTEFDSLLKTTVLSLIYEARENLEAILLALPYVPGRVLSFLLLPVIKAFGSIKHQDKIDISRSLCQSGTLRDVLLDNLYKSKSIENPLTRIDNAFMASINKKYKSISKRLKSLPADSPKRKPGESINDWLDSLIEAKIITKSEKTYFVHTQALILDSIMVDEFDSKTGKPVKRI